MPKYTGRSGAMLAIAAVVLAGCADSRMSESGSAPTASRSTSSAATGAPARPAAAAASTPATAPLASGTDTPHPTSYGVPSDIGSHGSVYSWLFGPKDKNADAPSEPSARPTSYGVPSDIGSHGSVYSWLFGSKDAPAGPPVAASDGSPPPR